MATITERETKSGVSYRIRASVGYDASGKQIMRSMTWTPKPTWGEAKIKKELERAAVMFEQQCQLDGIAKAPVKFSELGEMFLTEYAEKKLRPQTIHRLHFCRERADAALGHLRVDRIGLRQIQKFIDNLQEPGVSKAHDSARARPALLEIMKGQTQKALSEKTGVSRSRLSELLRGEQTSYRTAEKIAAALGQPVTTLFVITKSDRTLSAKSIRHYLNYVSSVLEHGIRLGMVSTNPCPKVQLPAIQKPEKQVFTLEEAQRFLESLEQAPAKYRSFFEIALIGGLRRGEILGLRWEDADLEARTISVRQSSQYLPEKGQYIDELKTASSRRTLKLPPEVFDHLRQWRAEQAEERLKLGDRWKNDGNLIFTGTEGQALYPSAPWNWLKRFCAETGQRFIGIHGFRHTNASLLIVEADADPVTVSRTLGHSQASTTLNIYSHAFESRQAQKTDEIARLLKGKNA